MVVSEFIIEMLKLGHIYQHSVENGNRSFLTSSSIDIEKNFPVCAELAKDAYQMHTARQRAEYDRLFTIKPDLDFPEFILNMSKDDNIFEVIYGILELNNIIITMLKLNFKTVHQTLQISGKEHLFDKPLIENFQVYINEMKTFDEACKKFLEEGLKIHRASKNK